MQKLLIIGVDSLAGSNLAAALCDRCETVGLSWRESFVLEGCRVFASCGDDADCVSQAIVEELPQWIVYCGPTSRSAWDWSDDFDSAREVEQVRAAAIAAERINCRLTLISSDAIFRGPQLFHSDQSETSELNPAALKVRAIEGCVAGTSALIVRTSLFGWTPTCQSWAETLCTMLEGEQPIVASGVRYTTPILASDAAEYIWQANRRGLSGVWHLGGAERASMWRFAVELASVYGTSIRTLRTAVPSALALQTRCGEESSLDSRRLQHTLGLPLPLVREGIGRFVDQARNGHRDRLATAVSAPVMVSSAA